MKLSGEFTKSLQIKTLSRQRESAECWKRTRENYFTCAPVVRVSVTVSIMAIMVQ